MQNSLCQSCRSTAILQSKNCRSCLSSRRYGFFLLFSPVNIDLRLGATASTNPVEKKSKWSEALTLEPGCAGILYDRARHLEGENDFENAIKDYQIAVTICPYDHAIRTRLGENEFSFSFFFPMLICLIFFEGLTYHKAGNLQLALINYLKTAALAPSYQLAWNNAGSIFFNTGFYERAEQCFSRCITLDKRASIAFNNRGLCHFLAGDGKSAIEDFTTAFQLNQADRTALPNRAAAYILVGEIGKRNKGREELRNLLHCRQSYRRL